MSRAVAVALICTVCLGIGVIAGWFARPPQTEAVLPKVAQSEGKTAGRIKATDTMANAESLRKIRQSVDEMLTGDPNGEAAWPAPPGREYETFCGVTPKGRYIVERTTNNGSTKYDEPSRPSAEFVQRWISIGCEKSSPVNTDLEERSRVQDEMVWISRPAITECLLHRMHLQAAGNFQASAEVGERTHRCRDPEAWEAEQKK